MPTINSFYTSIMHSTTNGKPYFPHLFLCRPSEILKYSKMCLLLDPAGTNLHIMYQDDPFLMDAFVMLPVYNDIQLVYHVQVSRLILQSRHVTRVWPISIVRNSHVCVRKVVFAFYKKDSIPFPLSLSCTMWGFLATIQA